MISEGQPASKTADPFLVTPQHRVWGSGAFFALKIQGADTLAQMNSLATEIDFLRTLSQAEGVVQIKDFALSRRYLRVVILLELGACDLHEYIERNTSVNAGAAHGIGLIIIKNLLQVYPLHVMQ